MWRWTVWDSPCKLLQQCLQGNKGIIHVSYFHYYCTITSHFCSSIWHKWAFSSFRTTFFCRHAFPHITLSWLPCNVTGLDFLRWFLLLVSPVTIGMLQTLVLSLLPFPIFPQQSCLVCSFECHLCSHNCEIYICIPDFCMIPVPSQHLSRASPIWTPDSLHSSVSSILTLYRGSLLHKAAEWWFFLSLKSLNASLLVDWLLRAPSRLMTSLLVCDRYLLSLQTWGDRIQQHLRFPATLWVYHLLLEFLNKKEW